MTFEERFDSFAEKILSNKKSEEGKYQQVLLKEAMLRDKIKSMMAIHGRTLTNLKADAKEVSSLAESARKQAKEQQEEEGKELEAVSQRVQNRINEEIKERKDSERRLVELVGSKLSNIKQKIVNQSRNRQTEIEEMAGSLESDIPSLIDMIKAEAESREEMGVRIAESSLKKLDELTLAIVEQKNLSQKSQSALLELTKQLINKTKKEMEEQQKARESTHDHLIELIDEACNKLMSKK